MVMMLRRSHPDREVVEGVVQQGVCNAGRAAACRLMLAS